MDPALLFVLSSSDESECNEKITRRHLRDRSNPLSLSKKAFIKRFRLNKYAFKHVLSLLNCQCQLSTAVPPILQLASTLLLLGSGGFQNSIGNDFLIGMCQSTVSKITDNVLQEMELKLCPRYIIFDPRNSARCKEWFMSKYNIPGVIGCIDGTHIGLRKPSINENMFFNRKGFHSLNAMIICDFEHRINAIDSKYGGAAHDSFIWRHSNQRNYLEERFQSNGNENAWLLGDSGYPLEPWCITPYRNPRNGSSESSFNEIHSKARCVVERTNAILKERWKILQHNKRSRYSPEKVARFGNVCSALHNVCIEFKVPFQIPLSTTTNTASEVYIGEETHLTRVGQKIRDHIKCSLFNRN